jgi:Domain of unknown function (DUF397)
LCDTHRGGYVTECSDANAAAFHISSFSGGGDCVAVARLSTGDYLVRHSQRHGSHIVFTPTEWKAFVSGVKNAEFDF